MICTNKKRRERIRNVRGILVDAVSELEDILEEEDECISNMPENLESSDKYIEMQECSDTIGCAIDDIETVVDALDGIT